MGSFFFINVLYSLLSCHVVIIVILKLSSSISILIVWLFQLCIRFCTKRMPFCYSFIITYSYYTTLILYCILISSYFVLTFLILTFFINMLCNHLESKPLLLDTILLFRSYILIELKVRCVYIVTLHSYYFTFHANFYQIMYSLNTTAIFY